MGARLSKTRYTTGLQCPKWLWWLVHEPEAPELVPDPALEVRFAWGHRVGEAARAHVPGGVLVERERGRLQDAVRATRDAIQAGAEVVYEAAFLADGVFVAVDILERRRDGWVVVEVKSSTRFKEEHLPDAAIQAWVVERSGLPVRRVDLMHLSRSHRHPGPPGLFARTDLTDQVQRRLGRIPDEVQTLRRALEGERPEVEVGPHCTSPRPCPFRDRCAPPAADDDIETLHGVGAKAWDLRARGCRRVTDLEPQGLNAIQRRQLRAVRTMRLVVEGEIGSALGRFRGPFAYLDFETVAPALPVWQGCRPYDAVPVQFVCLAEGPDGETRTFEWLAEGPEDPRAAIAERLVEALADAGSVFAYYASFEGRCLDHLAEAVPGLADPLRSIRDRLADLHRVVREHVYDPAFRGSFSIKDVLPALVPGAGYEDLEVAGGLAASAELERLLFLEPAMPEERRRRVRDSLRRYCRRDVEGLVHLHRWLEARARPRRRSPGAGPGAP